MKARDRYRPRPVASAPAWNGRKRCSGCSTPPPLSETSIWTFSPALLAETESTLRSFLESALVLLAIKLRNTCISLDRSAHTNGRPGSTVHCVAISSSCNMGVTTIFNSSSRTVRSTSTAWLAACRRIQLAIPLGKDSDVRLRSLRIHCESREKERQRRFATRQGVGAGPKPRAPEDLQMHPVP